MLVKLILFAALIAACFGPANAQSLAFSRGEVLNHSLSVCLKEKDAIELVKVHAAAGFEAANKLWGEKEECATVPVRGPTVGRVVFSAEITRDGVQRTAKAVELLGPDSKVLGYFLTTAPVAAKLSLPNDGSRRPS